MSYLKSSLSTQINKSLRIVLIEGESGSLASLHEYLIKSGHQANLLHRVDEALARLAQIDLVIFDSAAAQRPSSSKLVRAPAVIVLTHRPTDSLPPWLQGRHISLVNFPATPQTLVEQLPYYSSPRPLGFTLEPSSSEHLALLFGITQFLSGYLEQDDLYERVLTLAPYLNAEFAALLIRESGEISYYRSTQPGREDLLGSAGRRFAQRLLADGVEGWSLHHNQPVIIANTRHDSRWFRASYMPTQDHAVAVLPINLERVEAQGLYLIGHTQPGHFSEADLPLLKAVARQVGMAIENTLLFKNQLQRSTQLALINEVSQAATSILNLDLMQHTVVQAIRRSFACHSVSIHLLDHHTHRVELKARASVDPYDHAIVPTSHALKEGLIGWSVATNRTVLTNDVTREPRFIQTEASREVRSELCVPIALGTKIIGVLDLQSIQLEAFNRHHVTALETLADQLAIAIENARLYDEINRRVEQLKTLNQIGQAVVSTLNLQETLTLITDHATRLMEVAAASVVLLDEAAGEVWFAAASGEGSRQTIGWRLPLGQGIAGWVTQHGQPVIVPDVYTDTRFFAEIDKQSGFTTRSILCVPLQSKGKTIGAIEVMNKKVETFNDEDLALLQAMAAPAATAIENAQLYERQNQTIKSLAETQHQLIQSAKLAAVGELAAGVAHEINNPLTAIIALAGLLKETLPEERPLSVETQEDLDIIHKEARRARDIVRNLLDFARVEPPHLRPADFNQLVEEAVNLVYIKSVSYRVELQKALTPLPELQLDANQIKQVLVNLLNNAVQAMSDSDQPAILRISTHLKSSPNGPSTPPQIICCISDTGKGIPPEHLDKIFDPFFTTKEVGQGTGLGLSISYGIIKKHGGEISVESQAGQGATFSLSLPVIAPAFEDLEW
ncbi:MAG TPA: GAF domain-containing protein [Anaerolineae bacterium]|nr:GAF domain-containing protein [Anaerolineae bacterium]HMR67026.1 GAF domain-containing protein [Anaerolineae bacterium]